MKKYSEITLSDDERALLELLKKSNFQTVYRNSQGIFANAFSGLKRTDISWSNCFDWMKNLETYYIDKLLNPPHEPMTVWELEDGDEYWSVSAAGIVYKETWNNGCPDIDCRSQGNAFLTKKEAEFESKRRKVVAKVRKYSRPFKRVKDNWYPCYDAYNLLNTLLARECQVNVDYFDSEESIQKAIDEVGEEDFIKYYLGVTD